jgi:hypothetical protein
VNATADRERGARGSGRRAPRRALGRRGLCVALVAAALAVSLGVAGAAPPRSADGLHNARYCEILVLRGAVPDARVTVWNTIGLNRCPSVWWGSLDAAALADRRDAAAVILNGPRHFLMDEASGRAGRVRSFAGERLHRVATIPIESGADLVQAPYVERTIERRNTWRWNRCRRIYELLAPDGTRYVMQAYSQIRDPHLAPGDLAGLGSRLELPLGWRYRSRRLHRDLVLRAHGEATIVQDELLDTYQRLPRAPRASGDRRHRVALRGTTRTVGSTAAGALRDRGTVTGPPFGPGTVTLEVTLADGRATGSFRIDAGDGSAFGTVDMGFEIAGGEITFRGTAEILGGTGEFRGIEAHGLRAFDHNTLDGQSGTFTLDGHARY